MITENESVRLIFGLKVKSLRQGRGLSYHQLAEKTGLSLSYLHDIETGKKYPKADKILALGKALGADYDYLVSLHASKKLQPIIDLINSDFINAIPWEHFGLTPAALLDLFTNTPDKVTAFISTLLKISRSYQLSKEGFYNAALRSYQDLQDNYFEEIEVAANSFRLQNGISDDVSPNVEALCRLLEEKGISVNRRKMAGIESLQSVRSYYSRQQKVLFLNKGFSTAQEKFLLARELAFQFLGFKERPFTTMIILSASFEMLLNNFKASYFASALLMPEELFVQDVKQIVMQTKWQDKSWLDICSRYDVTPEMMMQRLTNILPKHFGIDHLFFLRLSGDTITDEYEITKELHLSQLHSPYANAMNEHYCRRWVAINSMRHAQELQAKKKYRHPVVEAQVSQYWNTLNRYLCISIAKPKSKGSDEMVSVTIGLMIEQQLLKSMPFVNDPDIPVRVVHTTCERCGISDCLERAAEPVEIRKQQQQESLLKGIDQLEGGDVKFR